MSTLDLLDDSFPHGTPNGYRRGCRTAACPALIPCRTVHTRYVGDFSFARLFDAGTPLTEILERDAAARDEARQSDKNAARKERDAAAMAARPRRAKPTPTPRAKRAAAPKPARQPHPAQDSHPRPSTPAAPRTRTHAGYQWIDKARAAAAQLPVDLAGTFTQAIDRYEAELDRHVDELAQGRDEQRDLRDRLRAATETLKTLAESENWKAWLRFAGLVRRRSFSNQMLILAQGGTYCLGYRQWEGLGRHVVKGAKSIKIFGYSTKRIVEVDETTGEESTSSRVIYPVLSVFDVSDTEGEPLPEQPAVYLEGDDVAGLFDKLAEYITGQGWDVALEDITQDGLNGYTDGTTRQIRVDSKMAPAMRVKTLLHEIGHALLHFDEGSTREHRGVIETEAESVAYGAGALLGIDTSSWSIGYVAGWAGGNVDLIRSVASNVLRAVNAIADAMLGDEDQAPAA